MPPSTEAALWKLDGWIMGPIGHAAYARKTRPGSCRSVRKRSNCWASARRAPTRASSRSTRTSTSFPAPHIRKACSIRKRWSPALRNSGRTTTVAMRVITRKGSNRVAREAIARTRKRKKVTAAQQGAGRRLACGMLAEECRKVAKEYPSHLRRSDDRHHLDETGDQQRRYDVVVTTNQFGDILTDIADELVRGGLGPRARPLRRRKNGDGAGDARLASDMAGRSMANPYAMITSGEIAAASAGSATSTTTRKPSPPPITCRRRSTRSSSNEDLTKDLGGNASTQQMGDAIAPPISNRQYGNAKKRNSHVQPAAQPRTVGIRDTCAISSRARSSRWRSKADRLKSMRSHAVGRSARSGLAGWRSRPRVL